MAIWLHARQPSPRPSCRSFVDGFVTFSFRGVKRFLQQNDVIYDLGDRTRTMFFLRNGFVKVGAITSNGQEVIYDVRREGDVVGELCASELERPDRAVALERTDAISVSFQEISDILMTSPDLMTGMIDVFCRALKEAYAQI
ncbi:MAG: Crp/Fnr family transcriptional regulator, partial [Bradyrhizobium sp.]